MKQLQDISTKDTLNIFCDASIKTYNDGTTIGCAGAFGFVGNNEHASVWRTSFIPPGATNNSSEIVALYLGVELAHMHSTFYKQINIFADSKICVYGATQWYTSWFQNIDHNGVLYSSSGQPVANQEMFKQLIRYMVMNNVHCNFYHQKGHVTSTSKSLMHAKKVFEESNGFTLDDDQLCIICNGNTFVDYTTGELLEYTSPENFNPCKTKLFVDANKLAFKAIVTQDDLNKYNTLLKGGSPYGS